ncbi:MAG TPA: hypothetical protein DD381_12230 [Lentisphaeria bacterium]|nr:MAG: hypothetical protein A2X47_09505 [Lentisphaerae bacterium GWF2_38_69]HBM17093.1 hypothetical protein [Lentisphaeria bacterium]
MLTKQKKSDNWYAVFKVDRKLKWISLKTEKKKIAEARYNGLKKRFDEDRDLQKAGSFVGINHEPTKEFQIRHLPKCKLNLSELVEKHEQLKPIPPGNMKWLKIFLAWMTDKHPAIIDAAEIDFDMAINFMRKEYGKKSGKTFNNVKFALSAVWKVLISYGLVNYWTMIPSKEKDPKHYRYR